ncbi:MAG: hypothetical protein KC416_02965 [Myxococcales bacterium]|nr:hypothetical protein [Myxococcales bacterium]
MTHLVRAWAMANLIHAVASPLPLDGDPVFAVLEVGTGVLAMAVWRWPGSVRWILAMAIAQPLALLLGPPIWGSHAAVLGILNLALVGVVVLRRGDPQALSRWVEAGRYLLLVVYLFSVFHKLNTAFLDPETSCATALVSEILPHGVASWFGWSWLTLLLETAIPVLVLFRRVRGFGIALGLTFHFLLSCIATFHFADFSSVMFALLLMASPQEAMEAWRSMWKGSREAKWDAVVFGSAAVAMLGRLLAWPSDWRSVVALILWSGYALPWVIAAFRMRKVVVASWQVRWHPVWLVTVLVAVLNGASPYFEIKTAYSFNMYSNLRTAQGRTNHLLLSGTWPLVRYQFDVAEVLESNRASLLAYPGSEYARPYLQRASYLRDHPETQIRFRRGGRLWDRPSRVELAEYSGWQERLHMYRAIDLRDEQRCLRGWMEAH